MLHDPNDQVLFPTLPETEIERLREHGAEKVFKTNEILFQEEATNYPFHVILEGRVRVTKQVGGEERVLTIHQPGQFTGEISMLSGAGAIATGRALGSVRALEIDAETFRRLMADCSALAQIVLGAMVERANDVERQTRQQEKLIAIGKLSAGLAHELNNPASAVQQAARQLHESIEQGQILVLHYDSRFTPQQREHLIALNYELLQQRETMPPLSPLAESDREDELNVWFEQRGMNSSWRFVPALVSAGMDLPKLDQLTVTFDESIFGSAINWLATTLNLTELTQQVSTGTGRISELVAAMKEYSHMDRANYQQVDLHQGVESTLTVLSHKIPADIVIVREFDEHLPLINAYGSELNQVWTHLLDNALDALRGKGHLWIRTSHDAERVRVEIADDGPGIPQAIQDRIWEPFFTTKGVGEGTGLGLDVVRRIVTQRHGGEVYVRSEPGDTRFEVYLSITNARDLTMGEE
ncbi:MAG: ATP-binding protein [Chloroflexota bacterium]